jgi:hypothetical protein
MDRRTTSGTLLGALLLGTIGTAFAQDGTAPYLGTWSRTLETCSLSDDEDETRLTISATTFKTYRDTCGMSVPELQDDRSFRANLACGGAGPSGRGLLRIYFRDSSQAVFFTSIGRARRSRDGIRCAPEMPGLRGEIPDPSAELPKLPKNPKDAWARLRALCAAPSTPNRLAVCAERRRIAATLRAQGLCHVTRGTRESWRSCRERP